MKLLDPQEHSELRFVDIIVSVYDPQNPEMLLLLADRFISTHRIEIIYDSPRHIKSSPQASPQGRAAMLKLAQESSSPLGRAWMRLSSLAAEEARELKVMPIFPNLAQKAILKIYSAFLKPFASTSGYKRFCDNPSDYFARTKSRPNRAIRNLLTLVGPAPIKK